MVSSGSVTGINKNITEDIDFCDCCVRTKKTRDGDPFNKSRPVIKRLLERIHADVCGPFITETHEGHKYYVAFTDDHTQLTITFLMTKKSETFEKFKESCSMSEAHHNIRI